MFLRIVADRDFFEQRQLPTILALVPEPTDDRFSNQQAYMTYREAGGAVIATRLRGELRLFTTSDREVRGTFNDVEVLLSDGGRRVLRDGFFEFGP